MREIKFRAWDEKGLFSKGSPTMHEEIEGSILLDCFLYDDDIIIEQYIGLKDKNCVEIYEGDIVDDKFNCGQYMRIYYSDSKACFMAEEFNTRITHYENDPARFCIALSISPETTTLGKVIGNIHENHELLETDNG